MNIVVEFLGPIEQESRHIKANSLKELSAILNEDENIKKWLDKSAIAVNDKMVKDINFALSENDKVSILPPVCGG